MDVPRTGRKQRGQGSHECKQYKRILPNPLFIACEARALLLFKHSGWHLQGRTISDPALNSHALICCGPPSVHYHTSCSPSWPCLRLLSSLLALQCLGHCTLHHRHARWSKGVRPSTPMTMARSPISSSNAALMAQLAPLCMCSITRLGARSPVPWAPSPAPLLSPPPSTVHHRGSVHTSAPIMPASVVPRRQHEICWS